MEINRSVIFSLLHKRKLFIFVPLLLLILFTQKSVHAENVSSIESLIKLTNPIYRAANPFQLLPTDFPKQSQNNENIDDVFATLGDDSIELQWLSALNGAVLYSPLIDKQKKIVYITSNTSTDNIELSVGKLTAINIADGSTIWDFKVNGTIAARRLLITIKLFIS